MGPVSLPDLPSELWQDILCRLPPDDIPSSAEICTRFRAVCANDRCDIYNIKSPSQATPADASGTFTAFGSKWSCTISPTKFPINYVHGRLFLRCAVQAGPTRAFSPRIRRNLRPSSDVPSIVSNSMLELLA